MAKRSSRRGRREPDRRGGREHRPLSSGLNLDGFAQLETGPDGIDHHVRAVPAARATKVYRCPGCDHPIAVGIAHVVAWPENAFGGAEARRHWHTGCWRGRGTRSVTRRWS